MNNKISEIDLFNDTIDEATFDELINFKFIPNMFIWSKNIEHRYIYSCKNHAKAAGQASQRNMIGKTDYDMPWKNSADFYQSTDTIVMKENILYRNKPERVLVGNRHLNMLVSKFQLVNKSGKCIGIVGTNYDMKDLFVVKPEGRYDTNNQTFHLGDQFNNRYLTKRELEVLRLVVKGQTAKQIAIRLKISYRTVEDYISIIKQKLQCRSKGDIITKVIDHGLIFLLLDSYN